MMNLKIEVIHEELFGYTLKVNDEVLMECLTEEDVNELTIEEINKLYQMDL